MFKFLAYGDIHHDAYQNGLTLADIVAVEDAITEDAVKCGIDTVLFLGDLYRATNPTQEVSMAAEAAWKRRSDQRIRTLILVGNHDRWTKSALSGHAFGRVGIFTRDLHNIVVFDKITQVLMDGVSILAIPSGYDIKTMGPIDRNHPILVLFHGLLEGSALANGGSVSGGIQPRDLAGVKAVLGLGADNHTHQQLDHFLGYQSMYLGATVQHGWGDVGQRRGWWRVSMQPSNGTCDIKTEFVESMAPKFVKIKLEAKSEIETTCAIASILDKELGGRPGVVDIMLVGPEAAKTNRDILQSNLQPFKLRRCTIGIDRASDAVSISPMMDKASTPESKWSAYVASGAAPGMGGLRPLELDRLGKMMIHMAKEM